ncbi:MAG: hypothetical protein GQ546_04060 [Gammaproteobacteria bacterium]|nr:hypothetical protein [Gammaproteobacteria bacterium]
MDSKQMDQLTLSTSVNYQITVQGWLDDSWSERLSGMHIEVKIPENKVPVAILDGTLKDQAELLGVLNSLYELHLPIISVELIALSQA